ncbi:MAG: carbohydrate binding domain-containing protein [Isosphaeraceae bacterium]
MSPRTEGARALERTDGRVRRPVFRDPRRPAMVGTRAIRRSGPTAAIWRISDVRYAALSMLALLAFPTFEAGAEDPIRIHPENPRYFQWKGRATVLVAASEHYGSVVNAGFDFTKYLAAVRAAGLNHTRVFLGDYVEAPKSFGIIDNSLAAAPGKLLAPWARSDRPGFALGGMKFDLDRWDPVYFERLHAFFRRAEAEGIVVEAVLFFVGPGWDTAPLNPRNNVNGTTPITATQYLSLDNGNILRYQEAYCRKLVRELNRYDHLVWNLCNEPWFYNQELPGFASQPPRAVKAWIRRVSEWVIDEESRLPKRHVLGVDLSNQGTVVAPDDLSGDFANLSVFNVHYDGNAQVLALNPRLPKLLAFNETGFNGTGDDLYRVQGWNFLLSGGGLYNHLDFSFTVGHEDGTATPRFLPGSYNGGGSRELRRQLAILLRFMNALPLEHMMPDNGLVVGGAERWSVLAWPGHAYALWLPGEGPIAPLLNLPEGDWRIDAVDILDGTVATQILGGKGWSRRVEVARRGGGAALRITRAAVVGTEKSRGAAATDPPAPVMLEDFDSYASDRELARAWYDPPHGSEPIQTLDREIKEGGKQALKLAYRTTSEPAKHYSAICRVAKWDASGRDAFQFWLKPDGSGRQLTFQVNIANRQGKNIHDLWQVRVPLAKGDTTPRVVTIPFAQLEHNIKYADSPDVRSVFEPAALIEIAFYVGGRDDEPGDGAYYFDGIRAVATKPMTRPSP